MGLPPNLTYELVTPTPSYIPFPHGDLPRTPSRSYRRWTLDEVPDLWAQLSPLCAMVGHPRKQTYPAKEKRSNYVFFNYIPDGGRRQRLQVSIRACGGESAAY